MNKKKQLKTTLVEGLKELFLDMGYELNRVKKINGQPSIVKELYADEEARNSFFKMKANLMSVEQLKKTIDKLKIELVKLGDEEVLAKEDLRKFLSSRAPDAHTKLLYDSHGNFVQDKVRVHSKDLMIKRGLMNLLQKEISQKSRHLLVQDFVECNPKYESKIYSTIINYYNNELIVVLGQPKKVQLELNEELDNLLDEKENSSTKIKGD